MEFLVRRVHYVQALSDKPGKEPHKIKGLFEATTILHDKATHSCISINRKDENVLAFFQKYISFFCPLFNIGLQCYGLFILTAVKTWCLLTSITCLGPGLGLIEVVCSFFFLS